MIKKFLALKKAPFMQTVEITHELPSLDRQQQIFIPASSVPIILTLRLPEIPQSQKTIQVLLPNSSPAIPAPIIESLSELRAEKNNIRSKITYWERQALSLNPLVQQKADIKLCELGAELDAINLKIARYEKPKPVITFEVKN